MHADIGRSYRYKTKYYELILQYLLSLVNIAYYCFYLYGNKDGMSTFAVILKLEPET